MAEGTGGALTYEMNWDCPRCDTRGLLGLTHRYCPGCGAPQDPSRRYFPPDDQKVAVADHKFVGADRSCPRCETPNARVADYCTSCGGPMDSTTKEVSRVVEPPPAGAPAGAKEGGGGGASKKGCIGCGAALAFLVLAGLVLLLANTLMTSDTSATVTGHSWQRTIEVEVYGTVSDSGWCDGLPSGARERSRTTKERSTRKEKDGQDCKVKKVDQQDGTFKEVQECTDRFREVPVMDNWCSYEVERWNTARTEKGAGSALVPSPTWPVVSARTCPIAAPGCEREGKRDENYVVRLQTPDGKQHDCDLPEATWTSMALKSSWSVEQGMLGSDLRCGSLKAAR
jgi:hypothetical protein